VRTNAWWNTAVNTDSEVSLFISFKKGRKNFEELIEKQSYFKIIFPPFSSQVLFVFDANFYCSDLSRPCLDLSKIL
jgi:hypothetical protein